MSFTVKTEEETKKEVEFELGLDTLDNYLEKAIDDLRGRIEVPGFRKGKAPKDVIKQRFYDELRDTAIEKLVNDSYKTLLAEKSWQPASQAKVKDLKTEGKINFTIEIETIPAFELTDYKEIELMKRKPVVNDQMIDRRLDELRERHARLIPANRPAQIDDLLVIDYETYEGENLIGAKEKITVEIGDRRNPEDLNRALVGMTPGDTKEFIITSDDKMLRYKVRLRELKEKQRPLLSDEFAREMKCASLNELKEKVREVLNREEEETMKDELLEHLSRYLIERHHFAVPEGLIKEEYKKILERQSLPDIPENWERFKSSADERVRLRFVLDKIADKERVLVEPAELENMIRIQAALLNSNFEEIKEKVMGTEAQDNLEGIIRREKTLNLVLDKAKIIEKGLIKSPWEAK